MRSNVQRRLAAILLMAFSVARAPAVRAQSGEPAPAPITPPVAPRIAKVDTLHGDVRVDDYYWLRNKSDSAVLRYIATENEWTAAGMRHTEALQHAVHRERVRADDQKVCLRVDQRHEEVVPVVGH